MTRETAFGLAPAELLHLSAAVSTRLCHDLAGPVGALNAGIELLADETDAAFITETAALLRHSAEAAAARLKFLRLAFGVSGGVMQRAADLQATVQGFLSASGSSVVLSWHLDPARTLGERQVQGVLLGVLAAFDMLRVGGEITVTGEGSGLFQFVLQGSSAGLGEEGRAVLAGDLRGVSPRTAPLAMLGMIAAGPAAVHYADGDGKPVLRVSLTANAV